MSEVKKVQAAEMLKEFQTILALEEEAATVYLQLAEDCDDAEASEILRRIASEEVAHVAIAKELVKLAQQCKSMENQ
ncbi:MAG: hypothetical protein K8R69_08440 [Deltaproteobacteria bacterium]|nr:hypothetical protein [Deltaproteobacteria bacterium]